MKTETMTVTVEKDLHQKLKDLADKKGRSKSNLVNRLLTLAIEKRVWKEV